MGTTKGKKSLRIGVIQSGRLIEEFIVKQQAPVIVGTNIRNNVVIADRSLPSRYKLFTYKNGQYYLEVMPQMKAELKNPSKQERIENQKRTVPLTIEDKGKVSINKTTILFQFIEAPQEYFVPKRIPPQFRNKPQNMIDWRFMGPLVFSIVMHVVWTSWMMSLDLSTQPITMAEIPDRFREAIIEKPKEEPKQEDIEKKDGEGEGEKEKEKPKKVVKKEKPKEEPKGKNEKEVRKAKAKKSIGKKSKTIAALRNIKKSGGGFGIMDDNPSGGGAGASSLSDMGLNAPGSGGAGGGGGSGSGLPGVRGGGSGGGGGTGITRSTKVSGAAGKVDVGGAKRTLKTRKVRKVSIKPKGRSQNLVMPGDPNINKSNAKKAVRKAMRKATGCYQREAKKNNSFAGRVVILITIGANGKPISVEIIQSKLNDSSLASSMTKCIKRKLKRVKFPKPAKPPISIRFTAVFSPGG